MIVAYLAEFPDLLVLKSRDSVHYFDFAITPEILQAQLIQHKDGTTAEAGALQRQGSGIRGGRIESQEEEAPGQSRRRG